MERSVRFNRREVLATLAGNKTMMRRVVKPQPPSNINDLHGGELSRRAPYQLECYETGHVIGYGFFSDEDGEKAYKFPYGNVGDRLWVCEAWGLIEDGMQSPICYRADLSAQWRSDPKLESERRTEGLDAEFVMPKKWRPSTHMPRWASRLILEITDVRVERLQDITPEDAVREGIESYAMDSRLTGYWTTAFARLWDEINGPGSWELNPWVWVVSFRRVTESEGVK